MASDATTINKDHFNDIASQYDERYSKTIDQLIEAVRNKKDFIGADWVDIDGPTDSDADAVAPRKLRFLDFACGTGALSMALAPLTTQCVGIDISEAMVAVYNRKASNQDLAEDEMRAYVCNMLDPSDPDPAALRGDGFRDFDVAGVGLALHHFPDPALALQRIADRVRPGGVVFVVDFLPHAHDDHGHGHGGGHHGHAHGHGHSHGESSEGAEPRDGSHTVQHRGFSSDDLEAAFAAAGVTQGFRYAALGEGAVTFAGTAAAHLARRQVFVARAAKAA